MNTTEKGNKLEDKFHKYLLDQQNRGELIFGSHPPELCKIYKKKKYKCKIREDVIEFDIVLEVFRQGRALPHFYVVFECKNRQRSLEEDHITPFSSKLYRIFPHAAKGVIVVSSRLQSGAENFARNNKIGIVKYNEHGFETVADRKGNQFTESRFVKSQIFSDERSVRALRFSAYHNGVYFGSIGQFLSSLNPDSSIQKEIKDNKFESSIPYLPSEEIRQSAQSILEKIEYKSGAVDLSKICSTLSIALQYSDQLVQDIEGNRILGSANFDQRSIIINHHENKHRERFTIAHEIGHFHLSHDNFLRSEAVLEEDLLINKEEDHKIKYERLEFQANTFASELILPEEIFKMAIAVGRERLDIKDKGFGYIFVDNQPCNYIPYDQLLLDLSAYFEVSKAAVEVKFKKLGMLNDQRYIPNKPSILAEIGNPSSSLNS